MPPPTTRIAVIGGGVSGLATAHYLYRAAQTAGISVQCIVLEGAGRLGGKILTEHAAGHVIEGGPESFVTRKPWAVDLCGDLGLRDRLIGATDAGRNYVLRRGLPVQVPRTPQGFLRTPLLSLRGKLRAACEVLIPAQRAEGDESLGRLVRRRFGREVLENLVGPAVGSIYLSDVDQLSSRVSFDRFVQLERTHGSLVKGMLASQRQHSASSARAGATNRPALPPFVTLPGGLGELIGALETRLGEFGCGVRTHARVMRLDRTEGPRAFQLALEDGTSVPANHVVMAIPAFGMARLIAPHDAISAASLEAVRYVAVATVTLVYQRADMPPAFDGFGVVVPAAEGLSTLASEVTSNKWPGHAAAGHVELRAFIGGQASEQLVAGSDAALVELAHRELAAIFQLRGAPVLSRVFRWQPGNPQYPVGHLDGLAQVDERLRQNLPGVWLTGAGMRGLGIPDCVRQAGETAAQVIGAITSPG